MSRFSQARLRQSATLILRSIFTEQGFQALQGKKWSLISLVLLVLGVVSDLLQIFGPATGIGFGIALLCCFGFGLAVIFRTRYCAACSYPLLVSFLFAIAFGGLFAAQKLWATDEYGVIASKFPEAGRIQLEMYSALVGIEDDIETIGKKIDENEMNAEERHQALMTLMSERLGTIVTVETLANALFTADIDRIKMLSNAGATVELIEQALKYQRSSVDPSVAYAFFQNTKNNTEAMEWFSQQISAGLNPIMTLQGGTYRQEEILAATIDAGNYEATKLLLEAGANPHPIQEIEGSNISNPLILNPLGGIGDQAENKQKFRELLLKHGAIVPSELKLDTDGTLASGSWEDDLRPASGYEGYTPSPGLCEKPKPALCEKVSARSGFDWCGFIAETPKVLFPPGSNPYQKIRMAQLNYFLGADDSRAFFLAHNSGQIVSLSKDRSEITAYRYTNSYRCPNNWEGYCWKKSQATGESNNFSGTDGTTYYLANFCAAKKKAQIKDAEKPIVDGWIDEFKAQTPILNQTTLRLLQNSVEPAKPEAVSSDTLSWLLFEDRSVLYHAKRLSEIFPDYPLQVFSWRDRRNNDAARNRIIEFNNSGNEKTSILTSENENSITAITYFTEEEHEEFGTKDYNLISMDLYEKITGDISENVQPSLPSKFYITAEVRGIEYDSTQTAYKLNAVEWSRGTAAWQPRQQVPEQVINSEAIPASLADKHLLYLWSKRRLPTLASNADLKNNRVFYREVGNGVFSQLQKRALNPKNLVVLNWNANQSAALAPQNFVLALDRVVTLDKIAVSLERANEIAENLPKWVRGSSFTGWKAVIELHDVTPSVHHYEKLSRNRTPSPAESWIITAKLGPILFVAPDNSIAAKIMPETFPLAGSDSP